MFFFNLEDFFMMTLFTWWLLFMLIRRRELKFAWEKRVWKILDAKETPNSDFKPGQITGWDTQFGSKTM